MGSLVPVIAAAGVVLRRQRAAGHRGRDAAARCCDRARASARGGTLADGSAAITGLLLGLTLPGGLAALDGVPRRRVRHRVRQGGLGRARAERLQSGAASAARSCRRAFPVAITTWPDRRAAASGRSRAISSRFPFTHPDPDAITSATPLGLLKFEGKGTELADLIIGNTGGSVGETAALVILAVRRLSRAAAATSTGGSRRASCSTVAVLSAHPARRRSRTRPDALFMLFSGGLMLGAVYMATDMVTSPVTNGGRWVFGVGIGVLVVVIRDLGRPARGRDVRDPVHERAGAVHQPGDAAAGVRHVAEDDDVTGGHQHVHGAPASATPAEDATPTWKLLLTLAVAGAAPGWLVVSVYDVTLPAIQKHAAEQIDGAVREVLKAPARWDTLYLVGTTR